jgi:hypothetical protein
MTVEDVLVAFLKLLDSFSRFVLIDHFIDVRLLSVEDVQSGGEELLVVNAPEDVKPVVYNVTREPPATPGSVAVYID